jgi:hypothetical protein
MTGTRFEHDNYYKYDLREPPRKIIHPDNIRTHKIENITDDWSNIPFYPNSEVKKEMIEKYGEKKAEEIIEYSYDNTCDPTRAIMPPNFNQNIDNLPNQNQNIGDLMQIKKYNEYLRQINSNNRIIPPNINKFSPVYSKIIAAKPRASTSANIRLGGVY